MYNKFKNAENKIVFEWMSLTNLRPGLFTIIDQNPPPINNLKDKRSKPKQRVLIFFFHDIQIKHFGLNTKPRIIF